MSENDIHLTVPVKPDEKESNFQNSFNIINMLTFISYLIYNFTIEWQNWEKLQRGGKNYNGSWEISVSDEIESQVLRLEEVCHNIYEITQIFIAVFCISVLWSLTRFVCRQWLIFEQAVHQSTSCQWFLSLVLLAVLKQLQTGLTLFGVLLILPTSFFTCYSGLSRYLCTTAVSIFIAWFTLSMILSIISKPILNYRVPYQELGAVGKNVSLDPPNKRKRKYKDNKYDEEEVELNSQETV